MAYPDFFKKHMQQFIAIAPVLYMKHMTAEIFVFMGENDKILATIYDKMGPEMFSEPARHT